MTLDDFFKGTKEAWEKEQRQLAEEAKVRVEAERRAKIDALKARRAGTPKADPPAAAVPPGVVIPAGNFQIESLPDRYRLHQVQYNNGVYVVDWSKELLDDGKNHLQQDWIALTQRSEWKIPDMQLYHATLSTLYRHRDHADKRQKKFVKELQQMFKKDFDPQKPYMATSTRIKYAASGRDTVTHNWGYFSAREHSLALVGQSAYINPTSGLETQMDAVLGSQDVAEIENVYEWISGMKPYLWRLNSTPAQDSERAAVLGCYFGRFGIDCDCIDDSWPSRGVVASSRAEISRGAP